MDTRWTYVWRLLFIVCVVTLPASIYAVTLTTTTVVTGNASVVGSLSKGSGSFVIDHPLDPKYSLLVFSFVESPDVKNFYDGIAMLDTNGEAQIELPGYFLALNMEYRYLASAVGQPMPNLHLKREIGRKYVGLIGPTVFTVAGGVPGGKISWQVSGIRHDRFIKAYPIIPEVPKAGSGIVEPGNCLFDVLCD